MIQKMVLFNFILLINFYLLIISNYSIGVPIPTDDKMTDEQELSNEEKSLLQCQRDMTYEEIQHILKHSPCTSSLPISSLESVRNKRNDTNDVTANKILALQSTINDHRTIIADHRQMIHYLMNNTVNITHLNQYYADQHTRMKPVWRSWRDVSLLLIIVISFCAIVGFLVMRLHLIDVLDSTLLRRYQNKQQQQNQTKKERTMVRQKHQDLESSKILGMPISHIEREYMRYQHGGSNPSL